MSAKYPTEMRALLGGLRGKKIASVSRSLMIQEHEALSIECADQEANGATEIEFETGEVIHFIAHTRTMSVLVGAGEMPEHGSSYQRRDVSKNPFWKVRVGRPVVAVWVWEPPAPNERDKTRCEFAVEFDLGDDINFAIEYVSDDDHADALIVTSGVSEPRAHRTLLLDDALYSEPNGD